MGHQKPRIRRGRLIAISAVGLVAVLVSVFCFLPIFRPAAQAGGWTVMVYMMGSDLEADYGLASRDLKEMTDSLQGDTRLLVMTDGVSDWADSPTDGICRIWQLKKTGRQLVGTFSGSMGDPAALRSFLSVGLKEAQNQTALILWDHGYGPLEGFGKDLRDETDRRLTLSELGQALRESGCTDRPLSLIGFDACLMAGCETAFSLQPYAEWLLASQETEPPEGWDYSFLQNLTSAVSPESLGKAIIHAYSSFYQKQYAAFPQCRQPYTLSLTNLAGLEPLKQAAAAFLNCLNEDLQKDQYPAVSRLRMNSWGFGRIMTSTEFDLIDLWELAASSLEHSTEAAAVHKALEGCVAAAGGSESAAHGLSLYFPQFGADNRPGWMDSVSLLSLPDSWKAFIHAYETALITYGPTYRHTARVNTENGRFALELSDEEVRDFVRAGYYILEGTPEEGLAMICGNGSYSLEGNLLTVPFHHQVISMTAKGKTFPLVSYWRQESREAAFYQSYAVAIHQLSSVPVRIRIEQDVKTGKWQALSAFALTDDDLVTGRQEIRLDWMETVWLPYSVRMPVRGENGELLPFFEWEYIRDVVEELDLRDGFDVSEISLPEDRGPYWLQINVWDIYNRQYASELIPIRSQE